MFITEVFKCYKVDGKFLEVASILTFYYANKK